MRIKGRNRLLSGIRNLLHKKEEGNAIDWMAGVIIMIMMFVMIMAFAAYGRQVDIRLDVNTVSKKYLYKLEEFGYLTSEEYNEYLDELKGIFTNSEDVTVTSITDSTGKSGTPVGKSNQVAYGDTVKLMAKIKFRNPIYTYMDTRGKKNKGTLWFSVTGLDEYTEYTIDISGTSKW